MKRIKMDNEAFIINQVRFKLAQWRKYDENRFNSQPVPGSTTSRVAEAIYRARSPHLQ